MSQAFFKFEPVRDEVNSYFILHSGIAEQFNAAQHVIVQFVAERRDQEGLVVYVCGPHGSGKSSFIRGLIEGCLKESVLFDVFRIEDENKFIDSSGRMVPVDSIVAKYQENKLRSGILFFEALDVPERAVSDPHVSSRLLSGAVCKLEYPQEEELRPILISLLERHYIRLRDKHIDEILQRVPAIPKYFELISKAIDDLISSKGKFNISKLKDVLEIHS